MNSPGREPARLYSTLIVPADRLDTSWPSDSTNCPQSCSREAIRDSSILKTDCSIPLKMLMSTGSTRAV